METLVRGFVVLLLSAAISVFVAFLGVYMLRTGSMWPNRTIKLPNYSRYALAAFYFVSALMILVALALKIANLRGDR